MATKTLPSLKKQGTSEKNFLKDLLVYLPSRFLPAITAFITTPIFTRLFMPEEFGYWALASGMNDFYLALATSSLGAATIRFYPLYKEKSDINVFFTILSVLIGIIIGVISALSFMILMIFKGSIPSKLFPLLLLTIPIFLVQAIFTVLLSLIRSQERSGVYTTFQLIYRYGSIGIGIFLVIVVGLRVDGLLFGTLATLVIATPFLFILSTQGVHLHHRYFRFEDARKFWQYTWPLAIGNIALWGLRLSDRYIISFFRSSSEVGLYSVAYNISGKSIDIIVALFLLSISPVLMNTYESEGRKETEKTLSMMTRLYLILCIPAVTGLSVLASPTISLFAAEPYHDGYKIVAYVALGSFFFGLSTLAHMGVMVKKDALRLGVNQLIAASVTLGLNVILVPSFGFIAAGITTLIGFALLAGLQAYSSHSHLTWHFPFRTLRNVSIASLGMALITWCIYNCSGSWEKIDFLHFLLSIIAAIPIYGGLLWILGEPNEFERASIKREIKNLSSKLPWRD